MSGRFKPRIVFPFYIPNARTARFEIEPFFSTVGYGISVSVIIELVGGTGKNRYFYERVVDTDAILRKQLVDSEMWEVYSEFMEGLYHNRIAPDLAVPVAASLLITDFKQLVDEYGLDLSEYVTEVMVAEKRRMGFDLHQPRECNDPNCPRYKN